MTIFEGLLQDRLKIFISMKTIITAVALFAISAFSTWLRSYLKDNNQPELLGFEIPVILPIVSWILFGIIPSILIVKDYRKHKDKLTLEKIDDEIINDKKDKDNQIIDDSIKNPISQEKMILPLIGDIFDTEIQYLVFPNSIRIDRVIGEDHMRKHIATAGFKQDQDTDQNSEMVRAFRIIQKTKNEKLVLRQGMVNFLNAYLQAFLQGNYRNLAKELLNTIDTSETNVIKDFQTKPKLLVTTHVPRATVLVD